MAMLFVIAAVLLLAATALLISGRNQKQMEEEALTDETFSVQITQNTEAVQEVLQTNEPLRVSLGNNLEVLGVGKYTGIYVEDGTDEVVSDVLMMKLANNGEDTVEYAKITMEIQGEIAEFSVSALKPGATIVLLEKNRMAYDKTINYSNATVNCENLALFRNAPSLREDKLTIQSLNGAINVTNISGQDIPGRIAIYYKNKAAGIYYGGITYRIVLENGLKAGEIGQLMASHFSETGSEIVFVTID